MPLEELEKKLYKPSEPQRPTEPSYKKFRPTGEEIQPKETSDWQEEIKKSPILSPKQKKTSKIIFWILFLLAASGGTAYYFLRQPFLKDHVLFTLSGPRDVRSGEKIALTINYKNNTPKVLADAELILSYPAGVILAGGPKVEPGKSGAIRYSLGNIGLGGGKQQEFQMRIIGEVDNTKRLSAKLTYKPENSSSRFENIAEADITIAAHGLVLDLEAPQKILSGERVTYVVRYSNVSHGTFSNVKIETSYPENFSFESADPEPAQGKNVWLINEVSPDGGGQIFIKGILRGDESESKPLKASVGIEEDGSFIAFREEKAISQIASSPILIASSVNEITDYIASPGDNLKYKITYKNNSSIGLREVILKVNLDGAMYDFSSLSTHAGFFDSRTNTITWNAGNMPQFLVLNPGEGGEVTFEIRLRKDYPMQTFTDKNFTVKMSATIETKTTGLLLAQEKISQTSEITNKVTGRLSVRSKGYFNSPAGLISNTGPLPPRVNQSTTYLVHWQAINFSNDAENVVIKTILPQGVDWASNVFALRSETKPEYNDRTGEVVWNIGNLSAGTGVILPVQEVAFQVRLTPNSSQTGRIIPILGQTAISGKDAFTGVNLNETTGLIPSDLPDDSTVSAEQGTIQ